MSLGRASMIITITMLFDYRRRHLFRNHSVAFTINDDCPAQTSCSFMLPRDDETYRRKEVISYEKKIN